MRPSMLKTSEAPGSLEMLENISIQEEHCHSSEQASLDPHEDLKLQESHFIGIDVGTGSVRACIIDSTGNMKALAVEDICLWQPEIGYYVSISTFDYKIPNDDNWAVTKTSQEQSTTNIWQCACLCVQRALVQSKTDPLTVRGIGFDATCSLAVFSHDTDEPIPVTPGFSNDGHDRNVILWLDHRPVAETKLINLTSHHLLRFLGGHMNEEMEIPKILWLKNNMSMQLFDRCKFYSLVDALSHMAIGTENHSHKTVREQGQFSVGLDGAAKGWQEDFYECVGLTELAKDNFKRIGAVDEDGHCLCAGDLVGCLSEKAGHELGLPAGIAVGSGVIDAYAGWIGTVAAKVDLEASNSEGCIATIDVSQACGQLAAVSGTSTCYLAMSKDQIFVQGIWGPYKDVLVPNFWMAGGQSATGELLKHVIETHPARNQALTKAMSLNLNVYDYLNLYLKGMAEDLNAPSLCYLGRHLFFYGDLWGNRSPIADLQMTGSIIGLTSSKTLDSLAVYYYATMEFIAMQTRHIIETMNHAGHSITSIFTSGSQCQNQILMKLMATVCGMPVIVPEYAHAAVVHGAAMLGAKAASTTKDGQSEELWSIMSRMSKPGAVTNPGNHEGEKKLLEIKYKVFLEQCYSQQVYRKDVDEAIRGWEKRE